jgi:hypothetical protein
MESFAAGSYQQSPIDDATTTPGSTSPTSVKSGTFPPKSNRQGYPYHQNGGMILPILACRAASLAYSTVDITSAFRVHTGV